ncbi:MAG: radical SAM family heme chaperone HemW, partial [Oscillospiraceae bacterium]|nr:radical SAM family heme chaperone HemW [Oscillospiraceae bacterium]
MANPLSLYIHIPFCAAKCPYCDFYSLSEVGGDLVEEYCTALLRQGETLAPLAMGRSVETIFFGGGTPSQLSADSIIRILVGLGKSFAISPTAEISIEVNPADADTAWFAAIKSAGVTRVSFGGQSFNDTALAALGRRHKGADITTSVQLAQSHGLDTSIDLMFALPKQDRADMLASLAAAVELGVGHISLYGLKVEEDTPFYAQRHTLCLPSEEAEADMYLAAVDFLAAGGYAQYEVSNFARHGLECRHNL